MLAGGALFALPVARPAVAQSGEEIIETALDRYAERVSGIDDYTVVQDVMGEEATLHFEKEMEDGFPTFVPVSTFTVIQERLDAQRGSVMAAAMAAGLGHTIEPELSTVPYGQFADFLGAAEEIGVDLLGGAGAVGDSPVEAVRDVLVRSAARAGLEKLAGAIGGARGQQIAQLAGGLTGLGDRNILGQLGQVALGELKGLALEKLAGALGGPVGALAGQALSGGGLGAIAGALGGAAPGGLGGGLAGVLGGGAAAGPGGLAAGVGMQAVGGLAQAGLGALMGGLGGVMAGAMTPDFRAFDRATARTTGPDLHALMRSVASNARVEGSEEIRGHDVWVIAVDDLSSVELPDSEEFTPDAITLHVDKELYVLRGATVSGEVEAKGERVPVSLESRLEDYREVEGLLHPFRSVTVVKGMEATLSEEERAQMEEMGPRMREQMEKMMEELEKMPPEQREMAERMMRQQMPQMEQMMKQMEAMTGAEPSGVTVQVLELRVNQGRPESLQVSFPHPG